MRQPVTVSLPEELVHSLDAVASEDGKNRSEVVRDALRRQFAVREFRRGRAEILNYVEARFGVLTDDDVCAMLDE